MNTNDEVRQRIHSWDPISLGKSLVVGSGVELLAIAPLAYYSMGHAGPNGGILGVLSFLFNLPGFLFAVWLTSALSVDLSWSGMIAAVFLAQTVVLVYMLFFILRLIGRRANSKNSSTRFVKASVGILSVAFLIISFGVTVKLAEASSSRLPDGCEDTVISQAVSPDGKYVATAYHRRCQSGLMTRADVTKVRAHFWSEEETRLELLPDVVNLYPVTVRWQGKRSLIVVSPKPPGVDTKKHYQDMFWKDIDIHYE